MPRPHRPNPLGPQPASAGLPETTRRNRAKQRQKQETRQERKERLRREAEERNAKTPPERRKKNRLATASKNHQRVDGFLALRLVHKHMAHTSDLAVPAWLPVAQAIVDSLISGMATRSGSCGPSSVD